MTPGVTGLVLVIVAAGFTEKPLPILFNLLNGEFAAFCSKPVAITVIVQLSCISLFSVAPKITFTSSPVSSSMYVDASLASYKLTSPVTFRIISVAPLMVVSSSGDSTAILIASAALFSPLPCPIPICAIPLSFMTVCTSAKSRLIREGTLIRSVIPCTACCNTSSAFFKPSSMPVLLSTISRSFSFGMTISVSTCSFSFSIPLSALVIRFLASKRKGLVTTPIVRISMDLAMDATTGAAPVPVPPPIPQVTNTMSAPLIAS